jgi:hypothetical protein
VTLLLCDRKTAAGGRDGEPDGGTGGGAAEREADCGRCGGHRTSQEGPEGGASTQTAVVADESHTNAHEREASASPQGMEKQKRVSMEGQSSAGGRATRVEWPTADRREWAAEEEEIMVERGMTVYLERGLEFVTREQA